MAYTTPEEWLARFRAAGFSLRIDACTMVPGRREHDWSDKALALWDEIRFPENADKWDAVRDEVQAQLGFRVTGWNYWPDEVPKR